MIYPFLPGDYDSLAVPLSTMIQAFGIIGLLPAIIVVLWTLFLKKYHKVKMIALYVSMFIILIIAIGIFISSSKLFAILIIIIFCSVLFQLKKRFLETSEQNRSRLLPVYIICLPFAIVSIQLMIAKPLTQWTRKMAITNANELITHLESFRAKFGHYPNSLQAMYKDYFPNVAGIEKYYYLPYDSSYNLSFEQPRFILDEIGTKEWIVYNPKDEHRVYSHTSWFLLLSPEELERSQGWFASGSTAYPHWKYFLFD
jgi:hypothetical protein